MKFKLTVLLLIAAVALTLSPQESTARKASYGECITVNPIGLAFGGINAMYERQISKNNSFTAGGYLYSSGDWMGYGIGGSYRWYIDLFKTRKRPIEGFAVGPRVRIDTWTWEGGRVSPYDDGITFTIGGEAVYKWIWDDFVLETGIVVNFNVAGLEGLDYSPFGLVGSIGYAW